MNGNARDIIDRLALRPHPEGGYYREVYRSEETLTIGAKVRNRITDIYFLLVEGAVSKVHRLLFDEIWHFYEGSPLLLFDIEPDFSNYEEIVLGTPEKGNIRYRHHIRGKRWQAAKSLGEYSLVGCTVAPGYDFEDFTLLDKKSAVSLTAKFPELKEYI